MTKYEFTPKSLKQLCKLDKKIQHKIIKKLDYYCSSEYPLSFADTITDWELGEYRSRVGDYRVIFDLEVEIIVIHKVGHRKDVYK